jgi:hypothetical protein
LETYLGFATAGQSAHFDNFPDAKHHVKEILIIILICLQVQFLHQRNALAFAVALGLVDAKV